MDRISGLPLREKARIGRDGHKKGCPRKVSLAGPVILVAVLFLVQVPSLHGGTVTLNGYSFSTDVVEAPDIQDSALLGDNPYFSDYPRLVDFQFGLYGYGSFSGKDNTLSYSQVFSVHGVQCSVIREQGWIPFFDPDDHRTSFDIVFCTAYYYMARDTQDNIHILRVEIFVDPPFSDILTWSVDDLPEGNTTLLYPSVPYAGQEVFGGHIESALTSIGGVTKEAEVIVFDELPYDYPAPYREYIVPRMGVFARACNWDGAINGFSQDGKNPDRTDDDKKAWEEWWDEHCFISACTGQDSPWSRLRNIFLDLRRARHTL